MVDELLKFMFEPSWPRAGKGGNGNEGEPVEGESPRCDVFCHVCSENTSTQLWRSWGGKMLVSRHKPNGNQFYTFRNKIVCKR